MTGERWPIVVFMRQRACVWSHLVEGETEGETGTFRRSVNERPVVTLWGAGGHIAKQQVLSQSGRLPGLLMRVLKGGRVCDWPQFKTDRSDNRRPLPTS